MVFAVTVSVPLVLAFAGEDTGETDLARDVDVFEVNDWTEPLLAFLVGCLCRRFGAGKLDFLSIASTVLWKRRKRASARTSVDSRSIVVDSSLTKFC